jgi:hypothetical protein
MDFNAGSGCCFMFAMVKAVSEAACFVLRGLGQGKGKFLLASSNLVDRRFYSGDDWFCFCLDICLASRIRSDGGGGAGRQLLETAWSFLSNFAKQVELFNAGSGSAVIMFAIGQALQGRVSEAARTIFEDEENFVSLIGPAKQAIAFYESQIKATKGAMHAWTQVGIRWKVVKDVRKLIAKLIWDSREEALYDGSERREQEEEEEQEEQKEQEPQLSARASRAQKRARK